MNVETKMARQAQRRAAKGRINDAFVKALPFDTGKGRIERDDVLPGFMVRIGATKKTFAYRTEKRRGAKRFWINNKLGDWPDLSAAKAREVAEALRVERKAGTIENTSTRAAKTIANVWPLFREAPTKKKRKKAELTVEELGYCYNRLSDEVKHTPLRELCNDLSIMEREAARMVKAHGQSASNNSVKFVRQLYRYANRDRKLPAGHPCELVAMVDPDTVKPVLLAHQLPVWWKEVQALSNPLHREAHLLTLLTGIRRDEIRCLRWEHLDVKGRRFRVPDPKGGPRKAFDVIMSRPMLRCLWRARRAGLVLFPGSPWVFPATSASGHLIRAAEVSVVNHGLRRTFTGIAKNHLGIDDADIGRMLNHSGKGATAVYVRSSPMGEAYLAMAEAISAAIMAALIGKKLPNKPMLAA